MFRILVAPLAILAIAASNTMARADVVTYDTSLTNPPGLYFGTGNSNTDFTVDTANGVEIGLSAIDRFIGPISPLGGGSDIYEVPLGNSTHGGSAWGVDFSINLQLPGGGSTLTLSQVDAVLTVTDVNTGFVNQSFPGFLGLLTGNACYGSGGADATCANIASDYGIQNSEPGSLFASIGDTGFNDNVQDTYDVTLSVYDCNTTNCTSNLVASDTIQIDAPEPNTLLIFATALLGLGFFIQRRGGLGRFGPRAC